MQVLDPGQQVPPHSGRPPAHVHCPPSQTWSMRHVAPQAPQWAGSLSRSAHTPSPQVVVPAAQPQTPPWHSPLAQTLPHRPQLFGSAARSVQPTS